MATDNRILFVNKTAASGKLSQSDGLERSRIFSHVQRSSFNRLFPPGSTKSPSPPRRPGALATPDGRRHSDSRGRRSRPRTPRSNTTVKKSVSAPGVLQRRWRHVDLPSPPKELKSGMDPSDTLPSASNPCVERLLDFYRSDIATRVFPVKSLAVVTREQTLSMAMQDPVLLSTLLGTTSAAIYCHNGNPEHGYAAMYYKGLALQRLHQKLSEPETAAVQISSVFAVSLLLWIECLQGNIDDLRAHVSGLQQLASRAQSICKSPLPIMTTILGCSYLCAAILQTQPTLKCPVLCEDRVSLHTRAALNEHIERSAHGMAHRFFSPAIVEIVSLGFLQIIGDQREVMLSKEIFASGAVDPSAEEVKYIFSKQMSVEYRLLSLPYESEQASLTPTEHALRLALFTFGQPILLVTNASAAFPRSMASQIKQHLVCSDLSDLWGANANLLLWILFVLAHISCGELEWEWCVSQISRIAHALDLHSLPTFEQALSGFYYFPEYFGQTLVAIWKEIGQKEVEQQDPSTPVVVVSQY